MNVESQNLRRQVLPWQGQTVVRMYVAARPLPYSTTFASLILEAYHSFLAGCPHASIITSGEALLRAIYSEIVKRLVQQGEIKLANTKVKLDAKNKDHIYFLSDYLTFDQA